MTRRNKQVYVTLEFNDGDKRLMGPLSAHDGGRLFRMAERNMVEMDLRKCGWQDAAHFRKKLSDTLGVSHV